MIDRSPLAWLNDAKSYALEALEIVREMDLEAFDRRRRDQLAVLFCLIAVGEALNNVPKDMRGLAPEIPWTAINGLRNRLVHSYFLISNRTIFRIARYDTQRLVASIDSLIEKVQ